MLTGKNIKLRALEPADVELLFRWENDETLWYLSNTLAPFSRFKLEQYVLNAGNDIFTDKQLRLMIDLLNQNSPATIGTIDLFDFDPHNQRAGIGVLIEEKFRNHGYAAETLETLINYCFNKLNLHQVYCNIAVTNKASLKLFQNAGFKIAGERKEWLLMGQNWVDELFLQLIKH